MFSGHDSPKNPFAQVDSYLRIRASDKTQSSGLISSMKNDGSGIKVTLPCYFECRFIGPNAIGTWPGFWLMTDYMTDYKIKGTRRHATSWTSSKRTAAKAPARRMPATLT